MVIAIYMLGVGLFALAFTLTRLPQSIGKVTAITQQALMVMTDDQVDDLTKERTTRQAALNLLKQAGFIALKGAATVTAALLPFWLANALALQPWDDSIEFALRWDVLGITTLVMLGGWLVWRRWFCRNDEKIKSQFNKDNPYSWIDRWFHHLAFSNTGLQNTMANIENKLFSSQWSDARAEQPIFITSLPRAGTTVLLEALFRLPGLATHTYRDMPFVLTPVLWAKISGNFHRQSLKRERAHGDGLVVNEDSPEAFEEVLWRKYYGHKYSGKHIDLWQTEDADAAFSECFREHMKKIVALRQPSHLMDGRYVSKNNGNIARIEALKTMFPDAYIIVPLRNPIEHSISLWRQHQNFTERHKADPFVCKYMADIGHYEFGALHRPIAFPGLEQMIKDLRPNSIDYWLTYWIATFQHLAVQEGLDFISYESLCKVGAQGLTRLCDHLDIKANNNAIVKAASVFNDPPRGRSHNHLFSHDLAEQAMRLHRALAQRCLLNT